MSDTTWPCRCDRCACPVDRCDVCGVKPRQVCERWCSEHPSNKAPCPTMAQRLAAVPQIEEHW